MSTTPDTNMPAPARPASQGAASRRFIISAEGDGTVIRSIPAARPTPRMASPLPEAAPADTAAEDRRHLVHMRRFLRTALDRTHR
jgi:hypothetical protein